MHSDEFYTLFNLRQEGIIMSITAPDNTDISLIQCCRVDEKGNKHILLLDYPTGIILKNEMHCLDASGNIVKSAGFTQDEVKYCEDYIMKNLDYIDCYREWLSDYAKMFVTLLEHAEMGTIKPDILLELTRCAMLKCHHPGYYERTVKGEVYGFFTRDDKVHPLTSCKKVIRDYRLKDKCNFLFEQFGLLKSK